MDNTIRAPAATAVASMPAPTIIGGGTAMLGVADTSHMTSIAPADGWHQPADHHDLVAFGFEASAVAAAGGVAATRLVRAGFRFIRGAI